MQCFCLPISLPSEPLVSKRVIAKNSFWHHSMSLCLCFYRGSCSNLHFFLEEPFPKHSDFLQDSSSVLFWYYGSYSQIRMYSEKSCNSVLSQCCGQNGTWKWRQTGYILHEKGRGGGEEWRKEIEENSKGLTIVLCTGLTFSTHQLCKLSNCSVKMMCRSQPCVVGRRVSGW